MQRLYETHKVLTYPRTDSRYLTSDILPTLKERLEAHPDRPLPLSGGPGCKTGVFRKSVPLSTTRKCRTHHAIIPTEQYVQLTAMSPEERKIYDLVVRRFLAVLLPACVYEECFLTAEAGGEPFAARGKTMLSQGWRAAYEVQPEEEEEGEELQEQNLPPLENGRKLKVQKLPPERRKNQAAGQVYGSHPSVRHGESGSLSGREGRKAGQDPWGRQAAWGRWPPGRILSKKLFHTFLLEKRGNEILITSKARQLLKLVPEDLKKPELTARWELRLSEMAKGKLRRGDFMKDIRNYAEELIHQIRQEEGVFRHENLTNKICPRCGKRLLAVKR